MKDAAEGSRSGFTGKHGVVRIDMGPAEGKPDAWTLTSRFVTVEVTEVDMFTITRPAP